MKQKDDTMARITPNDKYINWFQREWLKEGGLIASAVCADMLNISRNTIKDWTKNGKLRAIRFSEEDKRVFISFSEIQAIINELKDKNQNQKKTAPAQQTTPKNQDSNQQKVVLKNVPLTNSTESTPMKQFHT